MASDDFLASSPNEAILAELHKSTSQLLRAYAVADQKADTKGGKRRVRNQMEGTLEKLQLTLDRFSTVFGFVDDESLNDGDETGDE